MFWVAHLNFPKAIRLNFEQLEIVLATIMIVYLLSGIFVGIYFYLSRFKFSFICLILNSLSYLVLLTIWYQVIQFKFTIESYSIFYLTHLAVSSLFGISLIVSNSRHKPWLNRLGILIVILCLINFIYHIYPEFNKSPFLKNSRVILGFLGGLISVFWILNFQNEIDSQPLKNDSLVDSP